MKTKICGLCKEEKDIESFYVYRNLQRREKCKDCMRAVTNQRNKERRDKRDSITKFYNPDESRAFYRIK